MTTEEPFLLVIPYLALVIRVWMGANMMIHGYPKIKNMISVGFNYTDNSVK